MSGGEVDECTIYAGKRGPSPIVTGTQLMIYLDNTLVSAMAKQEDQSDLVALTALFELSDTGVISLVTSEVTRREIDNYKSQNRPKIVALYESLVKVPIVETSMLRGFSSHWDEHGGCCNPILDDEPIWLRLHALGLDDSDAHHVMVALLAGCSAFLTFDVRTILKHKEAIQEEFSIQLQTPSEFLASFAPLKA